MLSMDTRSASKRSPRGSAKKRGAQGHSRLIQGDTLAVLKTLPAQCVDVGITSPPYNKQEKNNGGLVSHVVYEGFVDKLPEADYQQQQIAVLNEIYRTTKAGGSFFYNHKIRWERGEMHHPMDWLRKTDWLVRQEIIWDRTIAGNIRGWRFWQVEERIYWLYKPSGSNKIGAELSSKDAKLTSVWRAVPEQNNPHPAPFPLWLPARIIIALAGDAKPPKTILDPYAGSGSTCVAAKLLGHHYLGIDISQPYIDYAQTRLANCQQEMAKIQKEQALHHIEKTFSERKRRGEYTPQYTKPKKKTAML